MFDKKVLMKIPMLFLMIIDVLKFKHNLAIIIGWENI